MNGIYAFSALSSFGSIGVFFLVAMLLGGRSDADRSTRRPYAVYLSSVLFLVIFGLLGLATGAAIPFFNRIGENRVDEFASTTPLHVAVRTLLIILVISIPVGAMFFSHWGFRKALRAEAGFVGSPQARTDRVFVYACCFTSLVTLMITVSVFVISAMEMLFPKFMHDSNDRTSAARTLLSLIIPIIGAAIIFTTFWSQARDDRPDVPLLGATEPMGSATGDV